MFSGFSDGAQGTLEYLVSIGVVVVISLVVVGLLVNQTGSAVNVSGTSSRISQSSGLISVSDAVVGVDGNGLITFSNNSGGLLTIVKLSVGGEDNNYSDVSLSQGDEKTFSLSGVGSGCSCVGFEGQIKTCEVIIYAESEFGLEKEFPVTVSVDCVSNATATNLSSVVQPVTGEGELELLPLVSFVSPTPLDGNRTANTSVDVNVDITSVPDLNEFKFNWNDTNYSIYDDSLVLMYNFDKVSALDENSTNITDVSKYRNNGTCTSCPTWNSIGKYGGAYEFTGGGSGSTMIDTGLDPSATLGQSFTISAWVRPIEGAESQGVAGGYTYPSHSGICFVQYTNGHWISQIDWEQPPTNIDLQLNNWSHVVSVYKGSDYIKTYVNGVLTDTAEQIVDITHNSEFYIGRAFSSWDEDNRYFKGSIDEVRVYNRTLSAEEIKQLYFSNFRKYDVNKWNFSSLPVDECPATGGTLTKVGEYCIHTFTTVGSSNFVVPDGDLNVDVLVVAGGGAGGSSHSGGGGAGGLIYNTLTVSGTKSVTVGDGGVHGGAQSRGGNGGDSVFDTLTAIGGGGGGGYYYWNGANGGSGGGCSLTGVPGTGTEGQGHDGGDGETPEDVMYAFGGGGGAGAVGVTASASSAGDGGIGLEFSQFSSVGGYPAGWFAGGGGGDTYHEPLHGGVGGLGGGGRGGSVDFGETSLPGVDGTGGGGGAGHDVGVDQLGSDGGSGIVIVRYLKIATTVGDYNYQVFVNDANVGSNQTEERIVTIFNDCPATGGTLTKFGNYCINTFDYNGIFNVPSGSLSADVLVVAGGGGGGGRRGGGGGAGGLIYSTGLSVSGTNNVTIGVGGLGGNPPPYAGPWNGYSGSNSVFDTLIAIGGGAGSGGGDSWGLSGGSGGGGSGDAGHTGTAEQGNDGGDGLAGGPNYGGGGGGGAGSAGTDGTTTIGGAGGDGTQYDINGTDVYYAGGGGGGTYIAGTAGIGGLGGGGAGGLAGYCSPGIDGANNTGGGGGGGSVTAEELNTAGGGNGGSGIVIVRYPKVS